MKRLAVAVAVAVLTGCGSTPAVVTVPAGTTPAVVEVAARAPVVPAHCVAHGLLPDPVCTPGATNPAVTQATIHRTICVRGWAATVRPPLSYTEPLNRLRVKAYGSPPGTSLRRLEFDHLIPLEIGGNPRAVANLWPETPATPNPKDAVENAGRAAVCRSKNPIPLATAQAAIAHDWVAFARTLGVKV